MKFKKKVEIVETVRWGGDNLNEVKALIDGIATIETSQSSHKLTIWACGNEWWAFAGDYIVKSGDKLIVCTSQYFESNYEPITNN